MADGVSLHNGEYYEHIDGESRLNDFLECFTYPITQQNLRRNAAALLNYLSDLESRVEEADKEYDEIEKEKDQLQDKLDDIGHLLQSN